MMKKRNPHDPIINSRRPYEVGNLYKFFEVAIDGGPDLSR